MESKNKKKKIKTPKTTKIKYFKSKRKGTAKCNLCKGKMHGVKSKHPKISSKLSKTEKRPTAMFAGILCNKCRVKAIEEAIKIKIGIKNISETDILLRQYVNSIIRRL